FGPDDGDALGIDFGQFANTQDWRGAGQSVVVEALREIEMGVKEEEPQRPALMCRYRLDRGISDTVIAAHHQRHSPDLQDIGDFRLEAPIALGRVARQDIDIAAIGDLYMLIDIEVPVEIIG